MHKNYSINIPLQRHLLKPVTLLFIQQDENQRVKRVTHAHPFWQLEYIIADTIEIKSGKSKRYFLVLHGIAKDFYPAHRTGFFRIE